MTDTFHILKGHVSDWSFNVFWMIKTNATDTEYYFYYFAYIALDYVLLFVVGFFFILNKNIALEPLTGVIYIWRIDIMESFDKKFKVTGYRNSFYIFYFYCLYLFTDFLFGWNWHLLALYLSIMFWLLSSQSKSAALK